MKISYGITVYNEYKELDNLLFHLSKHIREEDEVVVTQDISKKGTGVFEPEFQALEKILEKYDIKPKELYTKLRIILTGKKFGPSMNNLLTLLSTKEIVKRIKVNSE